MALTINPAGQTTGGEFDYYGKRYAAYNKSIQIFAVSNETSSHLFTIETENQAITSIAWSDPSNGDFIASISGNTLTIYKEVQLNSWDQVYQNRDHKGALTSLSWAPEHLGLHLLVSSLDKTISIFSYTSSSEWKKSTHLVHLQGVLSASWLYHDTIKTFLTQGESLKVWEYHSHNLTLAHQIFETFADVKACPSNSLIAGCTLTKLVIFDKSEGYERIEVQVGGNYVQWSAYGTILLLGSEQGVRVLRRVPNEKVTWEVVECIGEEGEFKPV